MIINSEHKLCGAFVRLFKTRNTFKTMYTVGLAKISVPSMLHFDEKI